jgi:RNA polymerase sigma-70 factor (ECF subfamily)
MAKLITSLFAASDEQTMWRVKMYDDPQAFARLVTREKPIQRLCAWMTGDPHRAEDLTQTAFARVFARRATGALGAILDVPVANRLEPCYDDLRQTQRRGECSLDGLERGGQRWRRAFRADEPSPHAQTDARERSELVREALLRLPPLYREIVVLRHYEALKFHEIAEVLEIPEGTAKSRMAEALTQLHRLLKHVNEDTTCNHKKRTLEPLAL